MSKIYNEYLRLKNIEFDEELYKKIYNKRREYKGR